MVSSIAVMLILGLSGCYKHVIRVEGMGSDRYDTYEPNYKLESDEDKSTSRKMVTVPCAGKDESRIFTRDNGRMKGGAGKLGLPSNRPRCRIDTK